MIVSHWRRVARVPSNAAENIIHGFVRGRSIDPTCTIPVLWDLCSRRNFGSRSRDRKGASGSFLDIDFYENQVKNSKQQSDKDLSIVRPLPKSALNHRQNRAKKESYHGSNGKYRRKSLSEDAPASRGPKKSNINTKPLEIDVSKPMFRDDWIKLRNKNAEESKETTSQDPLSKPFGRPLKQGNSATHSTKQKRTEKDQALNLAERFPPQHLDVFVSCLPGLEPFLVEELKGLGIDCTQESGGAAISSSLSVDEILRCHLHLGIASHVLVRCGERFTARGLPELKRKVSVLPWSQFIKKGTALQVRVSSKKSKLNHSTAIRTAVIEGINESFKKGKPSITEGVSQATGDSEKVLHMLVRIERDEVSISVDTSETPMHRRGYRLETAKAPLREDLAYGMLYSAGFRYLPNSMKHTTTYMSVLDPFCGSGTIAIEAAAIAAGLPPGRLRPPPMDGTVLFNSKAWRQLKGKALRKAERNSQSQKIQIAASDRDEGAIAAAEHNAQKAGVHEFITFQRTAIASHPWLDSKDEDSRKSITNNYTARPQYPLLIATNPPFGMRITADKRKSRTHPLLPLYQTLVDRLQRLANNNNAGGKVSAITLLQDPNLFRKTGAAFRVKFSSQHGGIPVAAVMTEFVPEEA